MYTIYYRENGKLKLHHANSWDGALSLLASLTDPSAYIRDNEYGVNFLKDGWCWERNDNLLGWAGGFQ